MARPFKNPDQFRPLLAEDVLPEQLRFPLLASPKADGIRGLTIPSTGKIFSRRLKPIPNLWLQKNAGWSMGLDGEITVGDCFSPGCFNETQSAVMTADFVPYGDWQFDWHLFDCFSPEVVNLPFYRRYEHLKELDENGDLPAFANVIPHEVVHDIDEFRILENQWALDGWEGIVVRDPEGRYKFGRSTVREQLMLRLKRWETIEARILSVYEQNENQNEAKRNALGLTERSSAKAGKVGKNTFGGVWCEHPMFDKPFKAATGEGITAAERDRLWSIRDQLPGQLASIRFQRAGMKDRPRFTLFQGIRHPDDLS